MSNSEAYLREHFRGRNFANKAINTFELEYNTLMDSSAELGPIFSELLPDSYWCIEMDGRVG